MCVSAHAMYSVVKLEKLIQLEIREYLKSSLDVRILRLKCEGSERDVYFFAASCLHTVFLSVTVMHTYTIQGSQRTSAVTSG